MAKREIEMQSAIRERIITEYGSQGYSYFKEVIISSAAQTDDLPRFRSLLLNNNIKHVDVTIVRPDTDETNRYVSTRVYNASGQCIEMWRPVNIPAYTNYIKLTLAYTTAEERDRSEVEVLRIISVFRMILGVSSAREIIFETAFDKNNQDGNTDLVEGYASPFDTQDINRFDSPPIENSKISKIPDGAAILLENAFQQRLPQSQFVLLWLALETIINALGNEKSNGVSREKFFRSDLGSEIINEEVHRLFKLRNAIFKEGALSVTNEIGRDCWSLYWAIQLAILQDCGQRSEFVKGYEIFIKGTNSLT